MGNEIMNNVSQQVRRGEKSYTKQRVDMIYMVRGKF
jgi:hypothetical protein